MDKVVSIANTLTAALFGPGSGIPSWFWFVFLGMVFWGLLINKQLDD